QGEDARRVDQRDRRARVGPAGGQQQQRQQAAHQNCTLAPNTAVGGRPGMYCSLEKFSGYSSSSLLAWAVTFWTSEVRASDERLSLKVYSTRRSSCTKSGSRIEFCAPNSGWN